MRKIPNQPSDIPIDVIEQIYANNEAFSKEFADAWNAYVDKMLIEITEREESKCQH
jgi:hypothetical protein